MNCTSPVQSCPTRFQLDPHYIAAHCHFQVGQPFTFVPFAADGTLEHQRIVVLPNFPPSPRVSQSVKSSIYDSVSENQLSGNSIFCPCARNLNYFRLHQLELESTFVDSIKIFFYMMTVYNGPIALFLIFGSKTSFLHLHKKYHIISPNIYHIYIRSGWKIGRIMWILNIN